MARPSEILELSMRSARNADVPVADTNEEGAANDDYDELAGSGDGHGPVATEELPLMDEAEPRLAKGAMERG